MFCISRFQNLWKGRGASLLIEIQFSSLLNKLEMRTVLTSCHSWQENNWKSRWKGLGQEIWPIDQKECRTTKKSANRPTLMVDGKKTRPMAQGLGRWVVGMANKPHSSLRSKITSPWSTTKHKTNKLRDLKARRTTETFRNSIRTRAWMIIECSNDDVQVLRTVKNGVSTIVLADLVPLQVDRPLPKYFPRNLLLRQ